MLDWDNYYKEQGIEKKEKEQQRQNKPKADTAQNQFQEFDKSLKKLETAHLYGAEKDAAQEKLLQANLAKEDKWIKIQQDTVGVKIRHLVKWFNHKMDEIGKGQHKLSVLESVHRNKEPVIVYRIIHRNIFWLRHFKITLIIRFTEREKHKTYEALIFKPYGLPLTWDRIVDRLNRDHLDTFSETNFYSNPRRYRPMWGDMLNSGFSMGHAEREEFLQSLEKAFLQLVVRCKNHDNNWLVTGLVIFSVWAIFRDYFTVG